MDPVEETTRAFKAGFNCSQAVFSPQAARLGLEPELALKIAAPFGGGVSRSGNVCGAVSGAMMAIGLKYGSASPDREAKEKTYQMGQEFAARFKSLHGSLLCPELLGCDLSTAEGQQAAKEGKLYSLVCPKLIQDAARILDEMLQPE